MRGHAVRPCEGDVPQIYSWWCRCRGRWSRWAVLGKIGLVAYLVPLAVTLRVVFGVYNVESAGPGCSWCVTGEFNSFAGSPRSYDAVENNGSPLFC